MTRLLQALRLAEVEVDETGRPVSFLLRGRPEQVIQVCNVWKVDDNWWRKPVARDYFKLQTAGGLLCVIYRERLEDAWYLERVFD